MKSVLDQYTEFLRVLLVVAKRIWNDLEGEVAQGWIKNDKALEKALRSVLLPPVLVPQQIKMWQKFYRKHFGIELGEVKIPEKKLGQEDFTRLLVVVKGLTNNKVYDACAKHFPCSRYVNDLDKDVPTNERDPKNGTYAIWVRDVVEADEAHKSKSADMIKQEKLKTETLLERMLHELVYFLETKKHLDLQNWTLCSGSRDSDGDVPSASMLVGRFYVGWSDAGYSREDLCVREVVS